MQRTARPLGLLAVAIAAGIGVFSLLALVTDRPENVRGTSGEQKVADALAAVERDEIVSVVERDAIAAIDDPVFVAAGEAQLEDDDFVIGVELQEEARAYPVRVLSAHEIVNDDIRGRPIAATW